MHTYGGFSYYYSYFHAYLCVFLWASITTENSSLAQYDFGPRSLLCGVISKCTAFLNHQSMWLYMYIYIFYVFCSHQFYENKYAFIHCGGLNKIGPYRPKGSGGVAL